MPAGGEAFLGDVLKDFYKDNRMTGHLSDETLKDIKVQIQKGNKEKASEMGTKAIEDRAISSDQLAYLYRKLGAPFMARVASADGQLKPEFLDFLSRQSPEYIKKFEKALGRMGQQEPVEKEAMGF
jgi:hypothetical protein